MQDIIIRNARLRTAPESPVDISIRKGKVQEITPAGQPLAGKREIDAAGGLVTESFVNPHLHLDKVYTLARLDEQALQHYHGGSMGKAMAAIESASRVKSGYSRDWALANIRQAVELAIQNGNTHIRAFADVDTKARLEGVEALIEIREEFRGRVAIQVVAFPQDGVVREPGAADLVREAMRAGADLVGGIPWIEYTDADAQAHIDAMFAIAAEFDKGVSMLVDDAGDPGLRTLEMMAIKTIATGMQGRVLAHHARAMALYPEPYFQKVVALLKQADMAVVSDPHTGPLAARVKGLLAEGCEVCLGQDDISDAYYPYGQNNLLEVAFLASHLLWMTTQVEMHQLYEMVTTRAARAMGLSDFELAPGNPANLVVLDVGEVVDALRYHRAPVHVISHGQVLK
jgi:cytosine deaminase